MISIADPIVPLNPTTLEFLGAPRKLFIDNQWVEAASGKTFATLDPSSGQTLVQVAAGDAEDIDRAVAAARAAFEAGAWHLRLSAAERGKILWKLADLIEQHAEVLAQLESLDVGKAYEQALHGDVQWSADHFRYYAGWPDKIQGRTVPASSMNNGLVYTRKEPIGVCGLIVPWNFPFEISAWKLAPALAAGNCVILKPAEQTPLSALYLGYLILEAGFPPGVVNIVTGLGPEAGAALVAHPGVDKVSFTGSTEVARSIIRASAANIKKLSLELGGKSPNIVFADADLDQIPASATNAVFGNAGQSCVAGTRLFIEKKAFDPIVEALAERAQKIRIGPGMSATKPEIGPLISERQLGRVMGFIAEGQSAGAKLRTGGQKIGGALDHGYFVQPTIFTDTTDDMSIVREEIFGPVVVAMPFEDVDELIRRVNASRYGLAAGVWTRDIKRAHAVAARIQAGTIWINTYGYFDPAAPFGGYKESGYGREMGPDAIDLYTQTKTVWVAN
jgi:acyl-CoA reductase-like NAD-dependent aldehyde dehydrogenase